MRCEQNENPPLLAEKELKADGSPGTPRFLASGWDAVMSQQVQKGSEGL